MSKCYTGIGSRQTPPEILSIMTRFALKMSRLGWILRSGGAVGADTAFEKGATRKDITIASDATPEAMKIAAKYHPMWSACSRYAQKLHGRNAFQVLGRDLKSPSSFLICWTIDGCISNKDRKRETGGTGTAISIADAHGVKIFNLQRQDHLARILKFIED